MTLQWNTISRIIHCLNSFHFFAIIIAVLSILSLRLIIFSLLLFRLLIGVQDEMELQSPFQGPFPRVNFVWANIQGYWLPSRLHGGVTIFSLFDLPFLFSSPYFLIHWVLPSFPICIFIYPPYNQISSSFFLIPLGIFCFRFFKSKS